MNKASNIIGKPIITPSGEELETIDDMIFDPDTHRALCFLVESGGWAGEARILPWSSELSIAVNAIIIASQDQIVLASKIPHIRDILENEPLSTGKEIMAPDGRRIGVLSDVYFDRNTGKVQGYEVTRVTWKTDAGHDVVLTPEEVDFTVDDNHVLLVSPATAERIEA